ncbi:hypothetical protein [Burkholderia cenocepacia]
MHKITAAILAAWGALHAAAASASLRVRSFLVDLHVSSLKAMVQRAEDRISRLSRLRAYHDHAADEAHKLMWEAVGAASTAANAAKAEAAKHGVTLEV